MDRKKSRFLPKQRPRQHPHRPMVLPIVDLDLRSRDVSMTRATVRAYNLQHPKPTRIFSVLKHGLRVIGKHPVKIRYLLRDHLDHGVAPPVPEHGWMMRPDSLISHRHQRQPFDPRRPPFRGSPGLLLRRVPRLDLHPHVSRVAKPGRLPHRITVSRPSALVTGQQGNRTCLQTRALPDVRAGVADRREDAVPLGHARMHDDLARERSRRIDRRDDRSERREFRVVTLKHQSCRVHSFLLQ